MTKSSFIPLLKLRMLSSKVTFSEAACIQSVCGGERYRFGLLAPAQDNSVGPFQHQTSLWGLLRPSLFPPLWKPYFTPLQSLLFMFYTEISFSDSLFQRTQSLTLPLGFFQQMMQKLFDIQSKRTKTNHILTLTPYKK